MSNDLKSRNKVERDKLAELLKRVPSGISSWSYQKTVQFKKNLKAAEGLLKKDVAGTENYLAKIETARKVLGLFEIRLKPKIGLVI